MTYYKCLQLESILYEEYGFLHLEYWKDISGFEGLYMISNLGRVKSLNRKVYNNNYKSGFAEIKERIRRQHKNEDGYLAVRLNKNGKPFHKSVSRLVGLHFVSNEFNKPEVNHKNGVRHDNRYFNLEFSNDSEQQFHSYRILNRKPYLKGREGNLHPMFGRSGILSKSNKKVFCITNNKYYFSATQASIELNLNLVCVCSVCTGVRKQTGGFAFRYV